MAAGRELPPTPVPGGEKEEGAGISNCQNLDVREYFSSGKCSLHPPVLPGTDFPPTPF